MTTLKEKVKELEKGEIVKALGECDWVMARAAKKLGITERMIGYKVKKYGLQKEGNRGKGDGEADTWQEGEKKYQALPER